MSRTGVALLLLVASAAVAGCLAPDDEPPQNLRTPRLVVDATPDNLTTFLVHAAFTSEELYDGITLSLDNRTAATGNHTYALTHKTNRSRTFVDVSVVDGRDQFRYRAQLDLNATADRVAVAAWDAQEERLGPARNATLPFKKVVPTYEPPTVEE